MQRTLKRELKVLETDIREGLKYANEKLCKNSYLFKC